MVLPLEALKKLDELCEKIKPKIIYEFGSGVSTIVLANYVSSHDCKIIILEDDPKYFIEIIELLRERFGSDIYKKIIFHEGIVKKADLVLVDGGGRFSKENRELYSKIITSQTTCLVDDTDRSENNEAVKKLAREKLLGKIDYKDSISFPKHQYSILYPIGFEPR